MIRKTKIDGEDCAILSMEQLRMIVLALNDLEYLRDKHNLHFSRVEQEFFENLRFFKENEAAS